MLPLLHDLAGESVLVFGGGRVGARRARTFAVESDVVVVSPTFSEHGFGDARRVRAAPSPDAVAEWVDRVDPVLVVAATDDTAVNATVERVAAERGLLYNRADRAGARDPCHVAIPSMVRDGDVVVGLSTGVPALTKVLRQRIEADVDGAGELAALTAELRRELRDVHPPERRRAALRAVVRSDRVWKALGDGVANPRQIVDEIVSEELGESP
ncbi:NAD(P)-dependent oxidoreductase [Halomarina oriensis]|uniref:precorrin-2 dehydrogenase n=1 Tax=Halomarina oriensis TaxID=671145 RepID=A0A6B0GJE2_9EURY|nr:bifunctional precorrin-2 dehydrogenase/sirohydrochlorin ferrochelatase [Halomarina oriensis]